MEDWVIINKGCNYNLGCI